jgi:hypothetical protein
MSFFYVTTKGKRTRIEDPSFVEATEALSDSVCRVASPNAEPGTAKGGRQGGARSASRHISAKKRSTKPSADGFPSQHAQTAISSIEFSNTL